MDVRRLVGSVPSPLRLASDEVEVSYELAEDVVATHGVDSSPSGVMRLEGERINVEPVTSAVTRDGLAPVDRVGRIPALLRLEPQLLMASADRR